MGDKPLTAIGWPVKTLLGALTPKLPKPPKPAPMPDPADQDEARRRAAAKAAGRSGYESTILTQGKLGPGV